MKQQKHDKKERKEQGITLVALVVTIVVLLILAGITITYVMGDKGIIKKAQEARNKMEQAIQNEQQEIGDLENWLDNEYINESTPVEPNPPKKMISFKISAYSYGEYTYQAEEGMTWQDFKDSSYNPSNEWRIASYTEANLDVPGVMVKDPDFVRSFVLGHYTTRWFGICGVGIFND